MTYQDIPDFEAIWNTFITGNPIPSQGIRSEIHASWQRCRQSGVDPYDGVSHQLLAAEEITELLDARKFYLETVRHFMTHLYEFVKGSGFIVLLADERGFVMETLGDADTLRSAAKVNLIQGACWVEVEGGTNGIGTALALGQPCQVSGCEHYCQKLHSWTCSAAPVRSDNGELIGVLQMSGPSRAAHQHTLGMVAAAAEAIRDQLRVQRRNNELTSLNEHLSNIFQTMSDGALLVNDRGVITQLNPRASRTLGDSVVGQSLSDIFSHASEVAAIMQHDRPCKDMEMMLDTEAGDVHALVTVRPLSNGSVIFFNPIQKMKKLANRFGGAQARFTFNDIVGRHDSFAVAISAAKKAATNNSNVMLLGESGTGKELLAQAIHNASARRKGPFLALNCAALPRDLIASELFGYAPGAFTGADPKGRPGKFEMAAGGTLLLDEIGDMPLDQQAVLLRVLQGRQVTRLGSDRVISVDVRVICATHSNLLQAVQQGNFRQDLYYRLNVVQIAVPPLRERGDDVQLLCDFFRHKIGQRLNIGTQDIAPNVRHFLGRYHWPGNVRELENTVEKMIYAAEGKRLESQHLPVEISKTMNMEKATPTQGITAEAGFKQVMAGRERQLLVDLLRSYHGNVTQIARDTGVSRNTIYRKMRSYDISRDYLFD